MNSHGPCRPTSPSSPKTRPLSCPREVTSLSFLRVWLRIATSFRPNVSAPTDENVWTSGTPLHTDLRTEEQYQSTDCSQTRLGINYSILIVPRTVRTFQ